MEKMPALPPKPDELIALETRRAKLRAERQQVETELRQIQDDAWVKTQLEVDPIDQAAELLATGAIETASREAVPEEVGILQSRRDLLQRAEAKVATRIAEHSDRHNRNIAGAYRPGHQKAAQRIARALRELVDANRVEQEIRDRAPNATLAPMDYPGIGVLGAAGGAAKYWFEHAKRHGYLEEAEAGWPAAAF